MPNLFADARAWLAGQLRTVAGVTATYTRGGSSAAITPWVGRTLFARNDRGPEGAARVEWGERDYLILAAELVLDGQRTKPAEGDRITEPVGGADLVFEILPVPGEQAWRWSDPQETWYRVHVKRVA